MQAIDSANEADALPFAIQHLLPECHGLGLLPFKQILSERRDLAVSLMPGYDEFAQLVQANETVLPSADRRRWVANQLFQPNGIMLSMDRQMPVLNWEGSEVTVSMPAELPPVKLPGPNVRGRLVMALEDPNLLAELKELSQAGNWQSAEVEDEAPKRTSRAWYLKAVEVTNEPVAKPDGPGGPGGPR